MIEVSGLHLNFINRIVYESILIIGEFILYNKIWALTKDLTSIPL